MESSVSFKKEQGEDYRARLEREFIQRIDPRLRAACFDLGWYFISHLAEPLVITQLIRTPEENAAIGGYRYSAHLTGRAADLRIWHLTEQQIGNVLEYLKGAWAEYLYVKRHDSGHGDHIHINIPYRYRLISGKDKL